MDSSIKYKIPIISSWRLNERHYGALVGLSKEGAERLYGKTQLKQWRGECSIPWHIYSFHVRFSSSHRLLL
jgi:bisphosphoglycerate-dependent phosphoglycerate mutase